MTNGPSDRGGEGRTQRAPLLRAPFIVRAVCGNRGVSMLEVIVSAVVVAIAVVVAVWMFAWGQTFVTAEGDNRVALFLAQQGIEHYRAQGFGAVRQAIGDPPSAPGSMPLGARICETDAEHPGYEWCRVIDCVQNDRYDVSTGESCPAGAAIRIRVEVTRLGRPKARPDEAPVQLQAVLADR